MIVVQAHELRDDLESYLAQVEQGQVLVVTRDNPSISSPQPPRPFGLCAGEFRTPSDFDAPLPDDILDEFESR